MTMTALSDELAQVRTKKKEFLAQIETDRPMEGMGYADPAVLLQRRAAAINPIHWRPCCGCICCKICMTLSDESTAAEAIDSRAFSDFCGVDSSNQVPNGDTIGRFRNLLVKNGLQEKLFAQVVTALTEQGLILKKVNDRRFHHYLPAPSSTKNKEKKRDPDAHQVKKGQHMALWL